MIAVDDEIGVKRYDPSTTEYVDAERYTLFWVKRGLDAVTIDGDRFLTQPNSVFFVVRGTPVQIEYGAHPQGWILTFSREVFRTITGQLIIKDADVLSTFGEVPRVILSPRIGARVATIAEMIDELMGSQLSHRETAVTALLRTLLVYCDSTCNVRVADDEKAHHVRIVTQYKDLVATRYAETHQTSDYARMLNVTPQHLNRVTKEILGVTAKDIIHEQLTIEARHALTFSDDSIKRIALQLGFSDPLYFSKYFKRHVGCTPSDYRLP